MKKVFVILIALFLCVSTLSASLLGASVQKGKVSIGASFGTSGSSEKTLKNDSKTYAIKSGNFGFVGRLRFDVMFSEKQSATVMASFDRPSKTVLVQNLSSAEDLDNPMYVKLFIGVSEHSVANSNLLIAVGVGPEVFYDINSKSFGGGAASYIRTSYEIPGTRFTFDTIAKGSATWDNIFTDKWVKDNIDLSGDVSVGFTYYII